MCYSAQIVGEWKRYVRQFGVKLSIKDYYDIFWRRAREAYGAKIPKAIEDGFADPQGDEEREIKALIEECRAAETTRLEQELFKQRKRLADAERTLQTKQTKKAQDDLRIAPGKVAQIRGWLDDLKRTTPEERDSRIFPMHYSHVMVAENGERVLKPMRYHCRPAGKPASIDGQFPGLYNARRDDLRKFWGLQFGRTHGIMLATRFYENVNRDGQNVVLEFEPQGLELMLVACLWSRWTGPGVPDLLSFTAITDEPPQEVAAAGHDRCIIPIKPEHVDAWLNPDPKNLAASYAILDDRERPYYEHRMAA